MELIHEQAAFSSHISQHHDHDISSEVSHAHDIGISQKPRNSKRPRYSFHRETSNIKSENAMLRRLTLNGELAALCFGCRF